MKTIRNAFSEGFSYFIESKGIRHANQETERLLCHSLNLNTDDLYKNFDRPLTKEQLIKLRQFFKERVSGKPFEYITGQTYFRRIKLQVDERVIIPRPETEAIVDLALQRAKQKSKVLELGTGSGAIALSLAREGKVNILATDISIDALEVAKICQ